MTRWVLFQKRIWNLALRIAQDLKAVRSGRLFLRTFQRAGQATAIKVPRTSLRTNAFVRQILLEYPPPRELNGHPIGLIGLGINTQHHTTSG
jgi:hypothetical protein